MKKNKLSIQNKKYNDAVLNSYMFADVANYTQLDNGSYEFDSSVLLRDANPNVSDAQVKTLSDIAYAKRVRYYSKRDAKRAAHQKKQNSILQNIDKFSKKVDEEYSKKQLELAGKTARVKKQKTDAIDRKISDYQAKIAGVKAECERRVYILYKEKAALLKTIDGMSIDNIEDKKHKAEFNKRLSILNKYNLKINKLILEKNLTVNKYQEKIAELKEKRHQIVTQPIYFAPLKRLFYKKNIGMLNRSIGLDLDERNEVRSRIIANFSKIHNVQDENTDAIKKIQVEYKHRELEYKKDYAKSVGTYNDKFEFKSNRELNKFTKKSITRKNLFTEKVYSRRVKFHDFLIKIKNIFVNAFSGEYKRTEYIENSENTTVCYDYKGRIKYIQAKGVENFNEVSELVDNTVSRVQDTHYTYTKKKKDKRANLLIDNALYILVVIFMIIVSIIQPRMISWGNIQNIINILGYYLPIALGVAGIIVLTGTDLSAGRAMGFIGLVIVSFEQTSPTIFPGLTHFPIPVALLIGVAIGALIGFVNGFFTAKFKIHPFIVTLATALILNALALSYLQLGTNSGSMISNAVPLLGTIVTKQLFGSQIQIYVVYVIILTIITYILWNKTSFGKNMFAVGSNPDAATVSGISVFKTTLLVFVFAGLVYAFQGFIATSYVGGFDANTGWGLELDAITACVVGGVSFTGGVGKIRGVIIGTLIVVLFYVSSTLLGLPPALSLLVKGLLVLVATSIDMRKYIVKK